ncbi:hypothetical protein GCM10027360_32740 [Amycolatopsis echigonensis]
MVGQWPADELNECRRQAANQSKQDDDCQQSAKSTGKHSDRGGEDQPGTVTSGEWSGRFPLR